MRGVCLLFLALPAVAQTNGTIEGLVDGTPKTLVSLDDEREVTTDESGHFTLPLVAPGFHQLKFLALGVPPAATTIDVETGATHFVRVTHHSDGGTEINGGLVDVGSATLAVSMRPETFHRLPLVTPLVGGARTAETLLDFAPQAVREVGLGYNLGGFQASELVTQLDGLRITDPRLGRLQPIVPLEFLDEARVQISGLSAEWAGSGLALTSKTGSQRIRGSVWGMYQPGLLTRPGRVAPAGTIGTTFRPWNLGDFGAELSGPIIEHWLTFYVAASPSFSRVQRRQQFRAMSITDDGKDLVREDNGAVSQSELTEEERHGFDDVRALSAIFKLALRLPKQHQLRLTTLFTSMEQAQTLPEVGQVSGLVDELRTASVALNYGGRLTPWLTAEALLGWHSQSSSHNAMGAEGSSTPQTMLARGDVSAGISGATLSDLLELGADAAGRCDAPGTRTGTTTVVDGQPQFLLKCPVSSFAHPVALGGIGLIESVNSNRIEVRTTFTARARLLGHHTIKLGAGFEWLGADVKQSFSGGEVISIDRFGNQTIEARPELKSSASSVTGSISLSESWQIIDALTLSVGARLETQSLHTDQRRLLTLWPMISPRAGLVYDFSRDGRGRLFAYYARYAQSVPLALADLPFKAVDPKLQPQTTDELSAGIEYDLLRRLRLSFIYSRRFLNQAVETLGLADGAQTQIGNPGFGSAASILKATRDYEALTFSASRAFADTWLLQASYTWTYLRGSYEGPGALPHATAAFDVPSALINSTGALPADRTHIIRLFVAKDLEFNRHVSVSIGAGYLGQSGQPISYLAWHPVSGANGTYVFSRGEAGRTGFEHSINARLAATYRLDHETSVTFSAEAFNLFNFQEATVMNQTFSSAQVAALSPASLGGRPPQDAACIAGSAIPCQSILVRTQRDGSPTRVTERDLNATFKQAQFYQLPFALRFGLRVSF